MFKSPKFVFALIFSVLFLISNRVVADTELVVDASLTTAAIILTALESNISKIDNQTQSNIVNLIDTAKDILLKNGFSVEFGASWSSVVNATEGLNSEIATLVNEGKDAFDLVFEIPARFNSAWSIFIQTLQQIKLSDNILNAIMRAAAAAWSALAQFGVGKTLENALDEVAATALNDTSYSEIQAACTVLIEALTMSNSTNSTALLMNSGSTMSVSAGLFFLLASGFVVL